MKEVRRFVFHHRTKEPRLIPSLPEKKLFSTTETRLFVFNLLVFVKVEMVSNPFFLTFFFLFSTDFSLEKKKKGRNSYCGDGHKLSTFFFSFLFHA